MQVLALENLREYLLRAVPILVHSTEQVVPPTINLVTPVYDYVEMNVSF